jgi:hypothetical protein
MHPILGNTRRLAMYAVAWLNVGVLLAVGLRADASWGAAFAFFVPLSLMYAFVSLSAWYVCRAFPVGARSRVWNLLTAHVVAAAVAAALWLGAAAGWARLLDWLSPGLAAGALYAAQTPLLVVVALLLFWLASVFHYMLIAFESSREAETRALALSLLAREAELKALRAQIDPHFIFNSLHSISALTASDPAAARRMCLLLADFLRETLRLGSNHRIPLADEITLAERFLAIEQIRLGARLRVCCDADPQASACLVPPLLLQPLVENAVVHGIGQLVEGGTIAMAARRTGPMVTITLENPCDPDRARTKGVGLGLDLLRQRLVTQFGSYEAVQAREEGGQFRVEVRIPFTAAA